MKYTSKRRTLDLWLTSVAQKSGDDGLSVWGFFDISIGCLAKKYLLKLKNRNFLTAFTQWDVRGKISIFAKASHTLVPYIWRRFWPSFVKVREIYIPYWYLWTETIHTKINLKFLTSKEIRSCRTSLKRLSTFLCRQPIKRVFEPPAGYTYASRECATFIFTVYLYILHRKLRSLP